MPIETHELLRVWIAALLLLIQLCWTIYWGVTIARKSAAKSEQDKLAEKLKTIEDAILKDERADGALFTKMEGRLQRVEDELKHMPSQEQFHEIQLSVRDIKADFRELAANLKPISASIERIDNFLMERANRV